MMLADIDHDGGLNRDEFYDFLNPEGESTGYHGASPLASHSPRMEAAPPPPRRAGLTLGHTATRLQRAAT